MSLRLGDIAPDFEQDSSEGRIRLHEWLGDSWGVLFSHPADFTPVCTTELGFTAKLKDQFAQRGVKVLALSVDPVESHLKWIDDINETQDTRVNFPIIADADRKVSELYDLIHPLEKRRPHYDYPPGHQRLRSHRPKRSSRPVYRPLPRTVAGSGDQ